MVERTEAEQATADGRFLRIGSSAGIAGSLVAMVGNFLHPVTPNPTTDPEGVARTIADSGAWVPVHLAIVLGLVLMFGGLVALAASITGGLAGALARLAHVAVVAGVTVGVILVTVDGVAAKHLADVWAVAPAEEQATALRVVLGEESINFALASLFNILFAGVAYILLGLAVALSRVYPRGLGWVAVAAGAGSIVVGTIQAYLGETTTVTQTLTIVFPTVITLWTAVVLVLLSARATALGRAASPGTSL